MTESTTQCRRERRRSHRIVTALAVVGLALAQARPGAAEPGALEQLPPPRACTLENGDGILCADGVGLNGAHDMAISPDGKNVYVAATSGDTLAIFARNPSTGALTQLPAPDGCFAESGDGITCTPAVALDGPTSAVVSRDGKFVYVGSAFSGIAVFARDRSGGRLTQLSGADGCLLDSGGGATGCADIAGPIRPSSLVLSPDGAHLYASASNDHAVAVFARDAVTGVLTQLPPPAGCIAENGDGIECTDAIGLFGALGMAVSRDGKQLYVASTYGDTLAIFARDRTTGALTQLPAPDGCFAEDGDGISCTDAVGLDGARAVAISKTGRQVYVASSTGNAIATFTREARTGTLSQPPAPGGCLRAGGDGITCNPVVSMFSPSSIALSKDGHHAYVTAVASGAVVIFSRDKTTGVLTQLAAPNGCMSATGNGITCEGGLALASAIDVVIPENGKHVYVASAGGDSVAAFAREK